MKRCRRTILVAIWLGIVLGLPFAGRRFRTTGAGRCALDGDVIEPIYQVRILDQRNEELRFCCLQCAQTWLATSPPPKAIFVTDEISGRALPAGQAVFVRSAVITNAATGNRVHAFANRDDAVRHAEVSRGTILAADDRPL